MFFLLSLRSSPLSSLLLLLQSLSSFLLPLLPPPLPLQVVPIELRWRPMMASQLSVSLALTNRLLARSPRRPLQTRNLAPAIVDPLVSPLLLSKLRSRRQSLKKK